MVQLYWFGTPNGQKVSVMLEEVGLPYQLHLVDLTKGDQFKPEFLAINPNNKIPAIVDPEGPEGVLTVFESGAILIYLAEKTGKLLPKSGSGRALALQWLMFQMGGVGPMFGQFMHFARFAKEKIPYGIDRYSAESVRILKVLDGHLARSEYLAGDGAYSIADVATYPWVDAILKQGALFAQPIPELEHVRRWSAAVGARPAVVRGMNVSGSQERPR